MRLFQLFLPTFCGLLLAISSSRAQTIIFSNPGTTYNNTDATTTDTYGSVDIANCTSISFSINYNFSLPFGGGGNMESSDECPFGIPPCQGDPNDPTGGGCDQCWDFLYVQFQIDGANVNTQLVGVPGSLNQTGTLTFGPVCTQNAATAGIIVQTQTWASNESITFSNITITCWDGSPATLTANPTPVCSGVPFNLSATLTEPAAVATTVWSGPGTIVSPNSLNTAVNNAPVGTNTYTFTTTDDNACTSSETIDVPVEQGPAMDDPPNITVCADEQISVPFTAGVGSPDFNWTNSNTAIGLGASGSGDLNFTAATVASAVTGTITVTPTENGCIGPSQTFTITVNPLPSVNQPNDVVVCAGAPVLVNFSGTAGATFEWTNDNTATGLGSTGVGNINFSTAAVANQEVSTVTVTPIRNGCPGPPLTFTITVNPSPTVIDPPNIQACAGEQVDVVFSGTGTPDFNWTNNNTAIGLGANGTGDISFTAANVISTITGTITVVPNANGCPGPSQNFTITVNPQPFVNQPADVTVCSGASIISTFTGSPGATFSWTNDNTNVGLGASGLGNINIPAANVTTQEMATVSVTPIINGCPGTPINYTITVNPPATVDDPANITVCSGGLVDLMFTGTASSFNWTNSNTAIGLPNAGSGDLNFLAASVTNPITSTVTVTPIGSCPGVVQTFTITVTPAPVVNQPSNIIACATTNVATVFSGTAGATFNWTNNNTAIGLAASGTGDLNFIAGSVTTVQTATITVTPTIGSCSGTPLTFTITINPAPTVVDPPNQTVCSGTAVSVVFSGNGSPVYSWTNTNTAIGLGAAGTGDINFTADNVGVGTITVTPSANGCTGASQTFDVSVIGSPVVTPTPDVQVCSGGAVSVAFTGTSGASFSWTNTNTAIGLGAAGSGDINFTAPTVTTTTTGTLVVTPNLNGCAGIPDTFQLSIAALPVITVNSVICAADLSTYAITLISNGTMVTTTAGTVTQSGVNFIIDNIPAGVNITISSMDALTGCSSQQSVNAPNCNCAPVNTPSMPNNPEICEGAPTPALIVVTDPGNTIDWYDAASGGTLLLMGNTSFTPPGFFVAGTYTFYAESREISSNCVSSIRTPVTLTVKEIPVATQIPDLTFCAGDPIDIAFSGTSGTTFDWISSNTTIGAPASGTGNFSFTGTPGNALITATPSLNGCTGFVMSFFIQVNAIPTVVPQMPQTVCAGTPVQLNFFGTVPGTVFTWTNNDPSIGLGASGTGNVGFTAANVTTPTLATISVTPTAAGCTGATENFTITVNPVPTFTAPSDVAVCVGAPVVVNFTGSNGVIFTWTNNNTNTGLGANGAGNIAFTSTNPGTTPLVSNISVTPEQNGCPGTAQPFSITVHPLPTITVTGTSCATDLQTYSVTVNSNATTLSSSAGVVTGNGNAFSISGVPAGTNIILTATSSANCTQQLSVAAPNCTCAPIAAPNNPNFPVICEGTATPTLMVSVPTGFTADWYGVPTGGTALLMGSTSFTPPGVFPPGSYTFYAQTRDPSSNCTSATRTPVFLTVNAAPTLTQPIDQTVCAGFVISVGFNGTNGATFNWTNSNPAIGLAATGVGNISFNAVNPGNTPVTSTITVTPTFLGCTGQSRTFVITVNPAPALTDPADVTACSGQSVSVNFSASTGATFAWTNNNAGIGLAASGTGNINFITGSQGMALVTVVASLNGCSSTPQTFNIAVVDNPTVTNPGNLSACGGTTMAVNFSGAPGISYAWSHTNPAIGLPASGTGNISFTASSNTGVQTSQVTVTPQMGACFGQPQTFTITINPIPAASIAGALVICDGGSTTLTASGGSVFSWNTGASTAAITVSPTTTTTYTATVTSNGCTATATATVGLSTTPVTAQATAVLAFGQNALSCIGATDATVNGSATGGSGMYQFSWSVAGEQNPVLTGIGAGDYSLTVTDGNQCTATASVTISEPPPLTFDIALDGFTCGASTITATITPNGGAEPFRVLVDGNLAPAGLSPELSDGNHVVEILDVNGCAADTMVTAFVPIAPMIGLPGEATVTLGEALVIEAVTNLNVWESLIWTPQPDTTCKACLRQEWIPDVSRVYEVMITDTFGCSALASIRVTVRKQVDLFVPNVFSPNLDGVHDFWVLNAGPSVVALNELQIFDRWGDLVYFWDAPVPVNEWGGWDGTTRGERVNPGVFVYYLEVLLANGEIAIKKGDLTVVR